MVDPRLDGAERGVQHRGDLVATSSSASCEPEVVAAPDVQRSPALLVLLRLLLLAVTFGASYALTTYLR